MRITPDEIDDRITVVYSEDLEVWTWWVEIHGGAILGQAPTEDEALGAAKQVLEDQDDTE